MAAALRSPNRTCLCGGPITGAGWWWFPAPIGSGFPWSSSCKREARIPAHRWKQLPPVASVGSLPAGPARGCRSRRCHFGGEAPRLFCCCTRLRSPSPFRHRRKALLAAEPAVPERCYVGARRARRLVEWFGVRLVVGGPATSVVCRRRRPRRQNCSKPSFASPTHRSQSDTDLVVNVVEPSKPRGDQSLREHTPVCSAHRLGVQ